MALTDVKVKTAKPKEKPYKLADSGGMYLLINANGSKYWRMKYRFAGKEKMFLLAYTPMFHWPTHERNVTRPEKSSPLEAIRVRQRKRKKSPSK